jgi:hypothetical protein
VYFERERGGDIMANKKYLIIAVLATFCLTATLFMVVPTKSQSGSYDPWTDVNGDGSIDMADISLGIEGFMSNGDATKPVNVTNWPTSQPVNITGHATKLVIAASFGALSAGQEWWSPNILVDGYSKVAVSVSLNQATNSLVMFGYDGVGPVNMFKFEQVSNFDFIFVKTYDVPNKYIIIVVYNGGAYTAQLFVDIYLMA